MNNRQHKVDKFLSQLPAEDYEAFMSLCGHNRDVTDLFRYLQNMGYTGSILSAYRWYNAAFPSGTVAQRINRAASDTVGLDVSQMLTHRASQLYLLVHKLEQQLARTQISDKEALQALPQLCREMRAMAAYAEERKYIKEKEKLFKAGADRVLREIEQIFKDQPIEAPVKKAIEAAWNKLEEELGS